MELLENMSNSCWEGNISMFPERQELLVNIIKELKPKTLIETGFNMGHSALLICNAINEIKKTDKEYENQVINFYVFDICIHECVKPNFEVLKEYFKDTINLYLEEGSTFDTIKVFNTLNNQLIDFVEVDGCHTYDGVRNDVMNLWGKLSNNGVIYVDDYKSTKIHLDEVDRGVNSIDWSNFSTDFIDGVFWAKKIN